MNYTLNTTKTAAVSQDYFWQPIETCPRGVKVQLANKRAGVAVYGIHTDKDTHFTHWAPLPKFKQED